MYAVSEPLSVVVSWRRLIQAIIWDRWWIVSDTFDRSSSGAIRICRRGTACHAACVVDFFLIDSISLIVVEMYASDHYIDS
jgi:hypothetical protein